VVVSAFSSLSRSNPVPISEREVVKVITGSTARELPLATISMPPSVASLTKGVTMANKSPSQHNSKKVGKSLKEKRNEKHAKKDSKKGILPD
jgi:hypothetical protein